MNRILYIILTVLLVFSANTIYSSTDINLLKSQINSANSEIEKINKEIEKLSRQITETSKEKKTLSNTISELNIKKSKLAKEKEQIEKKISTTNLVIKSLDQEISEKNSKINLSKKTLSTLIKELYINTENTFIEKLLSKSSFSEYSKELNNTISLNDSIKENIRILSNEKIKLSSTKNVKEEEKQKLGLLKNDLVGKVIAIDVNKKEKNSLLLETKNKESLYQKQLKETQKRKDDFEKSLEEYESQLKFILNPKSIPKAGTAVFSWPVDKVTITSKYGPRWGRFHYGLDFRASVGTPIYSIGDGVVLGTGDTDLSCKGASFGKWVFIKHNNGLSSTYAHLSSIKALVGKSIKKGEIIGYSGNTGSSTGPHLHLVIHASDGVNVDTVPSRSCSGKIFTQPISAISAYLDPADYLPTITSSMVKR